LLRSSACAHAADRMPMASLLRLLIVLVAGLLPLLAQERYATVEMLDGKLYAGRVVEMSLEVLQIDVGGQLIELPSAQVKTFRGSSEPPARTTPGVSWTGPLPDPVDPEAAMATPHDRRRLARLRARLELLDERYPWLAPAAPSQWLSLGLLTLAALGLSVFLSARVAGAEAAEGSRSFVLGVWYFLTALAQVALVPVHDFSVALMLLANTSLALFWLRLLFGLTRVGAIIALAVQLGFVVLGFGILELVTSVLASVGHASAVAS
jgi:hypothetical protein